MCALEKYALQIMSELVVNKMAGNRQFITEYKEFSNAFFASHVQLVTIYVKMANVQTVLEY
jgi:hypothetical protein